MVVFDQISGMPCGFSMVTAQSALLGTQGVCLNGLENLLVSISVPVPSMQQTYNPRRSTSLKLFAASLHPIFEVRT